MKTFKPDEPLGVHLYNKDMLRIACTEAFRLDQMIPVAGKTSSFDLNVFRQLLTSVLSVSSDKNNKPITASNIGNTFGLPYSVEENESFELVGDGVLAAKQINFAPLHKHDDVFQPFSHYLLKIEDLPNVPTRKPEIAINTFEFLKPSTQEKLDLWITALDNRENLDKLFAFGGHNRELDFEHILHSRLDTAITQDTIIN